MPFSGYTTEKRKQTNKPPVHCLTNRGFCRVIDQQFFFVFNRGNAAVLDAQLALLAQTLHATRLGRLMGLEGGIDGSHVSEAEIVSTFIVLLGIGKDYILNG